MFEEEVRGIIIGGDEVRYEFWSLDGTQKIAHEYFASDREAIAWFKAQHPGVRAEMRCFDQPSSTEEA